MADHAKIWTQQFIDEDGVPYGLCYAQCYEVTGSTRLAVWTDRDKTEPTTSGTVGDIDADTSGRLTLYGDGVYRILIRAAGDDGSGAPIATFEGVQLVDAEEAYDGTDSTFTLEAFEESVLSGQGRQAAPASAQSGTTLDLSLFDVAGGTYMVAGTASLLTFQYITTEDYENGARVTLRCTTNPFKLLARRSTNSSATYNLEIGRDFLMTVGSSIDLELRSGLWYECARFVYDAAYDKAEGTGVASAADLIVPGGSMVKVTGTTNITNVYWVQTSVAAPPGTDLELYFTGILTVSDGGGNVALNGDLTTAAGTVLGLRSLGVAGWVERYRSPSGELTSSLVGGTPSGKGAPVVYTTGTDHTTVTRIIDPVLGKRITIVNNDTTSQTAADTYTSARRQFSHEASASEGYLSLQYGDNYQMIAGDTLTLVCLLNGSGVKYWKEEGRTETSAIWPMIELTSASTNIGLWRPYHTVNVAGGACTIDTMNVTGLGVGSSRVFSIRGKTGTSACGFNHQATPTAGTVMIASGNNIGTEHEVLAFVLQSNYAGTEFWVSVNYQQGG